MTFSLSERLRRITSSGSFIPEIDGFRFLAISSVVLAHIVLVFRNNETRGLALDAGAAHAALLLERGTYGVEFFFVISGFILALPFIQQHVHGGREVRIGRYYLRRLTRLEPPYLLCLIGFTLASLWMGEADMARNEYLPSFVARLFYSHDLWFGQQPVLNGVTWTLEVEVQFYLLVPVLAGIFRCSPFVRRSVLLGIVLLWPWIEWPWHVATITLPAFVQYFAAGFLLADVYAASIARQLRRAWSYDLLALLALAAAFAWPVPANERPRLLALFIAVFYFAVFRSVALRSVFANPWITAIGGMCYSIYLLHFPFLVLLDRMLWKVAPGLNFAPGLVALVAIGVPVIALVAGAFFLLIERPCMDSAWPVKLWLTAKRGLEGARKAQPES